MHNIHSNNKRVVVVRIKALRFATKFLISESKVLGLGAIIGITSILATIINEEITKIEASYLTFRVVNIWGHNAFFGHNSSKSPGLSVS